MSARKGVYVTHQEPAESPPSPNAVQPWITIEIRAHWPENMGHEQRVAQIIRQLSHEAILKVYPIVGKWEGVEP